MVVGLVGVGLLVGGVGRMGRRIRRLCRAMTVTLLVLVRIGGGDGCLTRCGNHTRIVIVLLFFVFVVLVNVFSHG